MRDVANVRPGQTMLVTGASGGVGSFAVQIAKAFGAEVTGVCSTRNVDLVRSLGADHVIDYTRTAFTRAGKRYDVILDNVEAEPLAAVRRALTPTGTLIPNSGHGGRWLGPIGRIVKARVLSGFTRQQLKPFLSVEKRQDLLTLADLLATGKVTPVIDRTYPLDEAADALRSLAAGHARGKVVVTMTGRPTERGDVMGPNPGHRHHAGEQSARSRPARRRRGDRVRGVGGDRERGVRGNWRADLRCSDRGSSGLLRGQP